MPISRCTVPHWRTLQKTLRHKTVLPEQPYFSISYKHRWCFQDWFLTRKKLTRNEERMRELTSRWADKWNETVVVLDEHRMLALRKEGSSVVLDSDLPYLLCIDDDILSTGMKLYHLKVSIQCRP